jgi:hypothetical protein
LWLINAFAVALLTLLGAASEALGYDRGAVRDVVGNAVT